MNTAPVTHPGGMVGRAAELAELQQIFGETWNGQGRVVLLGGEAGTGKTRLVSEFLAGLGDTPVVAGGCVELGQAAVPFLALAAAMRDLSQKLSPDQLEDLLQGATEPLARFVPRLAQAAEMPAHSDPLALFGAVPELLDRLAGNGPAVLVLEDVHWADGSTLDLVRFLGQVGMPGRLVLLTYRSDEMRRRHPLRPILAELSRAREVSRIELAPLSDDDVVDLVRSIAGDAAATMPVSEVVRRAEGNPFFVEELVAAGWDEAGLPGPLRDVLAERLDRLPETAVDVVELVAAIGQRAGDALLRRIADPSIDLDRGLGAAIDAGLLVADGAGYGFRHALLQEATYDGMLAGRRLALHARIAAALTAEPGLALGGKHTADAEIAFHAAQAGDHDTAYLASIRAAEQAAQNYAVVEVHLHYERAVGLMDRVSVATEGPDRVEVLRRAASAAWDADESVGAVRNLEMALGLLPADEVEHRVQVRVESVRMRYRTGQSRAALAEQEAAEAEAGPEPSVARAIAMATRAWLGLVTLEPEAGLEPARAAVEMARSQRAEAAEAEALMALATVRLMLDDDHREGLAMGHEALAMAERLGMTDLQLTTYANIAYGLEYADQAEAAYEWSRDAVRDVDERGMTGTAVDFLKVSHAEALVAVGEWEEADSILRRVRFSRSAGVSQMYRDLVAGQLAILRGQLEQARSLITLLARDALAEGDQFTVAAHELRLRLALAEGDRSEIAASVEPVWDTLPRSETRSELPLARAVAVLAAEDPDQWTEQLDRLADHFETGLATAEGPGRRNLMIAGAHLLRAERGRIERRPDPAAWRAFLDAPLFAHDAVSGELYAGWRLAEALLETGEDATETLVAAHARAAELGSPYTSELERLARRARVRLPGQARDDQASAAVHGLTPREREVLEVLATGQTNRGIAEELFISEKTVSVHVTNLMAKLGVTNRTAAAAVGRELGLSRG